MNTSREDLIRSAGPHQLRQERRINYTRRRSYAGSDRHGSSLLSATIEQARARSRSRKRTLRSNSAMDINNNMAVIPSGQQASYVPNVYSSAGGVGQPYSDFASIPQTEPMSSQTFADTIYPQAYQMPSQPQFDHQVYPSPAASGTNYMPNSSLTNPNMGQFEHYDAERYNYL